MIFTLTKYRYEIRIKTNEKLTVCIILYLANIIVQPLLDHQFDKDAFLQTTSALFTIASTPSIYNRGKDHAVSWLALHSTSIKGVNEPHQPLFKHKEKTQDNYHHCNDESGFILLLRIILSSSQQSYSFETTHTRFRNAD